ncbi:hypothetical protein YC2023_066157 [Brassica napus]
MGDQLSSHILERIGGKTICDTQAYVPSARRLGRNLRSKTRWFTGLCNSHQVSHFATLFIDVRAEISVAESRFRLYIAALLPNKHCLRVGESRLFSYIFLDTFRAGAQEETGLPRVMFHRSQVVLFSGYDNDPSAGSLTETLLRLLLPLNDSGLLATSQTQTTHVAAIRTLHRIIQSVGATGGVYKGQGCSQRELMTRAY